MDQYYVTVTTHTYCMSQQAPSRKKNLKLFRLVMLKNEEEISLEQGFSQCHGQNRAWRLCYKIL